MAEVRVPKFGMSATEVEVLEICVAVGDDVSPEKVVVISASDKVDVEITADVTGRVARIDCEVGASYEMGAVLLVIDEA